VLGGLDALVFTAGIGEHAAPVRSRVMRSLGWLGLQPDEAANARHATVISTVDSAVTAMVVPTDEEAMLARHTWDLLQSA
jgi:acetate kinase